MTAREQLIRARIGVRTLAEQLQNISTACKRAGISRIHFSLFARTSEWPRWCRSGCRWPGYSEELGGGGVGA